MQPPKNLQTSYNREKFSNNLKRAREAKGLSQQLAAKETGLSFQAISVYEKGSEGNMPSIDRVAALADCYHVSIDSLIGRDAYCAGELKTPEDVAKILLMLQKLGIVRIDTNQDSIRFDVSDLRYSDAFYELHAYITQKESNKNITDSRFDEWYRCVYANTTTNTVPEQPYNLRSYKYKPFPQNIISAAFRGKYDAALPYLDFDGNIVEEIIVGLPQKEAAVLEKRYIEKKTLGQLGEAWGVSRERIRQIENEAMKKVRAHPYIRSMLGLKPM